MVLIIGLAASLATLLGGLFALYLRDRLHLILGFSAGAVLGVAFFDLMPEALSLAQGNLPEGIVTSLIALGFVIFMIIDRLIVLHGHEEEDGREHRGTFGAGSLSFHSFLDGVGIGLAFKVSPVVGVVVATAVLTHDFSDGINTVSLILKNSGNRGKAFFWLAIDSLMPFLGVITTLYFSLATDKLAVLLAIFTGFFLYIGASDLLPESHHAHPVKWTTFATIIGMAVIFFVVKLAGL